MNNTDNLSPEYVTLRISHHTTKFQQSVVSLEGAINRINEGAEVTSFLLDELVCGARDLRSQADDLMRLRRVSNIKDGQLDSLINCINKYADYTMRIFVNNINKLERSDSPFCQRYFRIYNEQ